MPTPICKNKEHPERNGEYCLCDLCKKILSCPKNNYSESCLQCTQSKDECDKFDNVIGPEYDDMIKGGLNIS